VARVFISYRREDGRLPAAYLADRLAARLGDGRVFRDETSIPAGARWAVEIVEEIDEAELFLAVIGPGWLSARDDFHRRRLDDPQDWVRREIQRGLASGRPVVPVLIGGASMPPRAALPAAIAGLADRQAVHLRIEPDELAALPDRRYHGVEDLAGHIRDLLDTRPARRRFALPVITFGTALAGASLAWGVGESAATGAIGGGAAAISCLATAMLIERAVPR